VEGIEIIVAAIALVSTTVAILIVFRNLRYNIGKAHLRISLLGIPLRKIKLEKISRITKSRTSPAENWSNTFKSSHRQLVIHRKGGLFKQLIITPRQRYIFKTTLEEAIAKRVKTLGGIKTPGG
jgi:hypothetical protein